MRVGGNVVFTSPFGQWLKSQRVRLALTQGDLACRVGYLPETIRKIEADVLHPSKQIIDLLGDHLGVPSAPGSMARQVNRCWAICLIHSLRSLAMTRMWRP